MWYETRTLRFSESIGTFRLIEFISAFIGGPDQLHSFKALKREYLFVVTISANYFILRLQSYPLEKAQIKCGQSFVK